MTNHERHFCPFSDQDAETLRDFCAILRNGGIKAFKEVVRLGEFLLSARQVSYSIISRLLVTTIYTALFIGLIVMVAYWMRL